MICDMYMALVGFSWELLTACPIEPIFWSRKHEFCNDPRVDINNFWVYPNGFGIMEKKLCWCLRVQSEIIWVDPKTAILIFIWGFKSLFQIFGFWNHLAFKILKGHPKTEPRHHGGYGASGAPVWFGPNIVLSPMCQTGWILFVGKLSSMVSIYIYIYMCVFK